MHWLVVKALDEQVKAKMVDIHQAIKSLLVECEEILLDELPDRLPPMKNI
jgi:hypothetical protein